MKAIKGVLIQNNLASLLETDMYKISEAECFEEFSFEAQLYARLEWSKFLRKHYSDIDRIRYLYEKCWEYSNPRKNIPSLDIQEQVKGCPEYGYFVRITEYTTDEPF